MRWVVLGDEHPGAIGGVATWTAAVIAALVREGHEVRVFVRARADLEPVHGARTVGVWGPSFGRRGGAWLGWRAAPALLRADRVLAVTWPTATFAARLGVDLGVVAHGSDLTRPPVSAADFARVWTRARRRAAVSRWLADRVVGGAVVLPAPIDAAPEPVRPVRSGTWAFVGRAVATKGGDRFVRWVAQAGVEGLVVGDGPELSSWRALARSCRARVRFVGALDREQTRALLRVVDLVALPSRTWSDGSGAEGLGLVALEAAALGVPAVGTGVGGLPEALGPAGLLVPAPDDAADVVERVRAWWSIERGAEAWAALRDRHGTAKTARALVEWP